MDLGEPARIGVPLYEWIQAGETVLRTRSVIGDVRAKGLVILAVLLATAHATPNAHAEGAWALTLVLDDPAAKEVRVDATARGLGPNATLSRIPANITLDPGGDATLDNGTLRLAPREGIARFSYRVPIARDADRFLLVRLADVLPGGVEGAPEARAPAGWSAVASRALEGVAVFSADLVVEERTIQNATVRVAATGPPPAADWTYLARAFPYLGARHARTSDDLLVVHAPTAHEAASVGDAIVLPAEGDLHGLARAFVRMQQSYRVVEVAPASAAWLREGEERYHALASLLAAGLASPAEVDEEIARARAVADPDATLPRAPAGSTLARQKGLVVVRALDAALRDTGSGAASLGDLLQSLENDTRRHDSADVEYAAVTIGGAPMAAFFERYVYGARWPDTPPMGAAPDVVATRLELDPARVAQGETATLRYEIVNLGTRPGALDLPVAVDGALVARVPVRLDVGERASGTVLVHARETGDHTVTMGTRAAPLRVLAPPSLGIARASATPDPPRADQAFVLVVYVRNAGESPGIARVEVREDGALLGRTSEATIAGSSTDALTIPLRLDKAGLHVLDVTLLGEQGDALQHEVDVRSGAEPSRETPLGGIVVLLGILAASRLARQRDFATARHRDDGVIEECRVVAPSHRRASAIRRALRKRPR